MIVAPSRGRRPPLQLNEVTRAFSDARAAYKTSLDNEHARRISGVRLSGSSHDYHIQSEYAYFKSVEIARDICRNDIIVGQGIERLIANIMQCGFSLDPKTGNSNIDQFVKERWQLFSRSKTESDITGQHTFDSLARLVLRHSIVDGDSIVLPLSSGQLQVVENHRLRTPRSIGDDAAKLCIHGVQLNGLRQRTKYYITKDDISSSDVPGLMDVVAYPAYNADGSPAVLHIYHPKRVTQTRGIPKTEVITDHVGMHDDINFAKLVQQQHVSAWSVFVKRPMGWEHPGGLEPEVYYEQDGETGVMKAIQNVTAGMMYLGNPGEEIQGFSPNVPNPTFFDHSRQVQQLIALNLDLPLVLFLMDASETNFSGWRGALESAKLAFRHFQQWFAESFHREVFRWKMRQWLTPGSGHEDYALMAISQRGYNLFNHEWVFPTWPYIEPLKDASADLLEMRNSLTSPRRVMQRRGMDWDVVFRETITDNANAIREAMVAAHEINSSKPASQDPVQWREVLNTPTPDGVQINLAPEKPEPPAAPKQGANNDD